VNLSRLGSATRKII